MADEETPKLTGKDMAVISFQAGLMAIPYIGSSLEHLIFGPLTELRIKRIEKTLAEVAEELGPKKAESAINERFATFLESMTPELGRSLNEDKRRRFRDLLTNAAVLPENSEGWEEAQLALGLLKEIETPGLVLLSSIARLEPAGALILTSKPVPQLFQGEFKYENPGNPQHALPYDWVVIEYWARWLHERKIITYSSHDARGGFGGVATAELGKFLVKWTLRP